MPKRIMLSVAALVAASAVVPAPASAAAPDPYRREGLRGSQLRGPVVRGTPPVVKPGRKMAGPRAGGGGVRVTVDVLDRNGAKPPTQNAGYVAFSPLTGGEGFYADLADGHAEGTLPAGDYAVWTYVTTPENTTQTTAVVYRANQRIGDDTAITLDARETRPLRVAVAGRPGARVLDGQAGLSRRVGGKEIGLGGLPMKDGYVSPVPAGMDVRVLAEGLLTENGAEFGSPYQYNLAWRQKIAPGPVTLSARDEDLAVVRTAHQSEGPPACAGGHSGVKWPGAGGGTSFFSGLGPAPAVRTEYYTTGYTWDSTTMLTPSSCTFGFDDTEIWTRDRRFDKPGPVPDTWPAAPIGPRGALILWGGHEGGEPGVIIYGHSTATATSGIAPFPGTTGTTVLRDSHGKVVYTSDQPGVARGWKAPPPGDYTLTVDEQRAAPFTRLATRQHNVWKVHVTDTERIDLPTITTATPLDGDSAAPAGEQQRLTLTVEGAPKATSPALRASFDDGATWQAVKVAREEGKWVATLTNPANGFVSLRTTAAGVDQTVIRAYAIR
ncbi:hypothetical protein [Actinomadura terrae]|uniref:hypothetical protein n=1 Tax=Actinomadura terrae TaxID=604353 RepID=UPI001FA803D6|nr:hypothetical protein [Actinomadura terrae]